MHSSSLRRDSLKVAKLIQALIENVVTIIHASYLYHCEHDGMLMIAFR